MKIDISNISLPAIAMDKHGSTYTEKFSSEFSEKFKDNKEFLKECAVAFLGREGQSKDTLRCCCRTYRLFCLFALSRGLSTLSCIDGQVAKDYSQFLKGKCPGNSWYSYYTEWKRSLEGLVENNLWPRIIQGETKTTEAHTPHAFRQIMKCLRVEMERIRVKSTRLEIDIPNGRILTTSDIDEMTRSGRSVLTEKQLDELEERFSEKKTTKYYKLSRGELAEKYGVSDPKTIDRWEAQLLSGDYRHNNRLAQMTEVERMELEFDLFAPRRPYIQSLAEKYGVAIVTIFKIKKSIKEKKRPPGCDYRITLAREDVIATISHFLPDWPIIGIFGDDGDQKYRIYNEKRGVLLGATASREKAEALVADKQGVSVHGLRISHRAKLNPGESLLSHFSSNGTELARHLRTLFPNGVVDIIEYYFPTTYDWSCILLYWFCLTGWNNETVESVTTFDFDFSRFNPKNEMELISDDHVIIKGWKSRGQPDDDPKPFTHISEKSDEYGLYSVLKNYYLWTEKTLRRFLNVNQESALLIGVGATTSPLTIYGPVEGGRKLTSSKGTIRKFFQRHEIYEDEECCERVIDSNSRRLRTTYEAVLEDMGVPAYVIALYMGHTTMDTTFTSYGAEKVSAGIQTEKIRKNLNEIEEKIFKGELIPYVQIKKEKEAKGEVLVFSHLENDIILCRNRLKPTWKGYELYIPKKGGVCSILQKCLFCKQGRVTEETIPYLLKWRDDLIEWRQEAGFLEFPLESLMRFMAISEILDICRSSEELFWVEALKKAEIIYMDPSFVAPYFTQ